MSPDTSGAFIPEQSATLAGSSGGANDEGRLGAMVASPISAKYANDRGDGGDDLVPEVSATVSAKWAKGSGGPAGDGVQNLVPIAFDSKRGGGEGEVSPALRSMGGEKPNAGGQVAVAYNIHSKNSVAMKGDGNAEAALETETARSLDAAGFTANQGGTVVAENKPFEIGPTGGKYTVLSPTLDSRSKDGPIRNQLAPGIQSGMAVRRLTPVECERLMGMPDNYTRIPWRGKPAELCPDGPRYRAIGNSMAVPVIKWIGQRIELMEIINNDQ